MLSRDLDGHDGLVAGAVEWDRQQSPRGRHEGEEQEEADPYPRSRQGGECPVPHLEGDERHQHELDRLLRGVEVVVPEALRPADHQQGTDHRRQHVSEEGPALRGAPTRDQARRHHSQRQQAEIGQERLEGRHQEWAHGWSRTAIGSGSRSGRQAAQAHQALVRM